MGIEWPSRLFGNVLGNRVLDRKTPVKDWEQHPHHSGLMIPSKGGDSFENRTQIDTLETVKRQWGIQPMTLRFSSTVASTNVNQVKAVEEIHLKDYTPPSHLIPKTDLTFDLLAEDNVIVSSKLTVEANPKSKAPSHTLTLVGAPAVAPEGSQTPTMELLSVKVNGTALPPNDYTREGENLTLKNLPQGPFTLEIQTRINPKANRSLAGLYTSGGKFTTQC
ncbi:MAG: hypothetical protein K2X66_09835, partial [Cyanobacteria bacterium]|nr:hypothetical protein [Cyanobacteriota bacterium]